MGAVILNLTPDPIDSRDYIFEWDSTAILPHAVDLRNYTGMIENQLSIGSCSANATVSACEAYLIANGVFDDTNQTDSHDLSRLFNYYNSRQLLGGIFAEQDLGSTARMALRSAKTQGIPSEQTWPYVEADWNTRPSEASYTSALDLRVGEYCRIKAYNMSPIEDLNAIGQIKYALAKGWPVLIGMRVGAKLLTLTPSERYSYVHPTNNPYIGGHEMLIVGYSGDDFIIENSWGRDWCEHGYFFCSQYVVNVDQIDIWVMKGFAGYTRVGGDVTMSHNEWLVRTAFDDMLKRAPKIEGLTYWIGRLNEGMSHADLRRSLARSAEFLTIHQVFTTIQQTVESLYRDILLREADAAGLAGWSASGLPLDQIIEGFIMSAEFSNLFRE